MPRFVILEHDHPFLHWDLMLESGDVLRTWRLLERPVPGAAIRAEALGEHRKIFLDYEGPVSGQRGTVKRWDEGTFEWETRGTGQLAVRLEGQTLRGMVSLTRSVAGEWSFVLSGNG
jgi:DNA polymerase Ligase (LigD)